MWRGKVGTGLNDRGCDKTIRHICLKSQTVVDEAGYLWWWDGNRKGCPGVSGARPEGVLRAWGADT